MDQADKKQELRKRVSFDLREAVPLTDEQLHVQGNKFA
jgi:hypothetical protein